ncbi:MAG: helix-turn-helix domain-containing protein [archaeon]|nr:helix-turn-helix domain-containing protein [archaeon]
MGTKYIELDLNDPRAGVIAEVMANVSCKKIINLLAEKEMSEGDLSKELKAPLNTIEYNIKKLVSAGLIEKTKGFFWSSRGKKINSYKIVNKKIIISPKSSFRGIVPAVVASVLGAVGIKLYYDNSASMNYTVPVASDSAQMLIKSSGEEAVRTASSGIADSAVGTAANLSYLSNNIWAWFLLGALTALLIFVLWNLREK